MPKKRKTELPKRQPTDTCNAVTRAGGYCRKSAGWGTDHFGYGRCRLHGGASPVLHNPGRYALDSKSLSELYERFRAKSEPLDLLEELALLRAMVEDYVARYADFKTIFEDWHASWKLSKPDVLERDLAQAVRDFADGYALNDKSRRILSAMITGAVVPWRSRYNRHLNARPQHMLPDIADVSRVVVRVGQLVRIINEQSKNEMISLATAADTYAKFAKIVADVLTAHPDLLTAIQTRVGELRVAYTPDGFAGPAVRPPRRTIEVSLEGSERNV